MNKRKARPSQLLYVPPARRSSKKLDDNDLTSTDSNHRTKLKIKDRFLLGKTDYTANNGIHLENLVEDIQSSENQLKIVCNNSSDVQMQDVVETMVGIDIKDSFTQKTGDSVSENSMNVETASNKTEPLNDRNLIARNNEIDTKNEDEIDKDKEEIKRVIEKINKKSRPFIKHCENANDNIFFIDEEERHSGNSYSKKKTTRDGSIHEERIVSWEDILFEDETKTIPHYTNDNYKAEEYRPDSPKSSDGISSIDKKLEDLDHVIEVYDFPESFKTQDIMQLYSDVHRDPMYIKWCDNTHALLVFSSPSQARTALKYEKGIIKARTLAEASPQSKKLANKSDLKPAMRRPATNMQTARRLINRHLGTRVSISREDMEKEQQELKNAKEKKRLQRQNEKDAWEGHPRTNI